MFDLKKRNSLTLSCSRDAEEFRRVAVRRKVKSAAGHAVSSGVRGSYSSGHSSVCGSNTELPADEDIKRSPGKGALLKPQVSPKPVHLQSPLKAQARSPTTGRLNGTEYDQSPNRANGVSCDSPVQDSLGSPASVRRGLNSPGKGVTLSPVRHTRRAPHIITSPVFGSHCPSKRGSQSPLKDSGHSPKLSPRSQSPLTGKLRTPSPVQGKVGSYSPGRISKSWLGLYRIPSSNMDGQEKQAAKSLSVPDLIVYLDDNRDRSEKSEFSPRKLPQPPKCSQPALTIKAPVSHRLYQSTDNGEEQSSQQTRDAEEEDFTAVCVNGSDERLDKTSETEGEQTDERGADNARDEENTEQKLYKIANELLQTERAYVARLHLLDQVFCSQLTEEAGRGSFPAEVIKNIFSNISSIYSFHSQFLLPDLENCLRHWNDSPGLGNVLLQHAPYLRMYADYVMNFDQAMELLRTWNERSSAFRNIVQDIQSQEVCGCLKLQHHMLEPVQRVPRYELLLRDYLKKLPKDDPDYELAHKSLQTISMAATHSNSAISKAERIKRLLEIYEMVGDEEVVNPTNEFLKEGRLLKLAARNTSSMERHLFLFNNFLLCCTPKFSLVGQRFTVRCRIGVDGMQVQQTTNEDHPCSFQVSGKERTLELQASSEQDRDEWIKVTQEAIDVFQKKNATFKLVSKELNVDHTTEELGRRAPRWIRDHEVNLCMKCQEPFNAFTRRRHHCRACGCVVCWKCSDNKVALEYDGNKLNKVCKSCYSILTGQRGERLDGKKRRSLESKMPLQSSESLMSSFLYYGDDPKTWQQMWCVIARSEPMTLRLYAAPQDVKPMSCIPLLGCDLEDTPQELQGQLGFRINQSRTTHTFSCDASDLKQTWLAVLKDTMSEHMLEGKHSGCDSATSGSKCEINTDVKYEESTINGNIERSS